MSPFGAKVRSQARGQVRPWRVAAALALLVRAAPGAASQPTPPVTIEIAGEATARAGDVVAVVTVTANVAVGKVRLSVKPSADLSVATEPRDIDLSQKRVQVIRVPIAVAKPGAHRVEFTVQAQAKGFETAGRTARRHVVFDGTNPARILTGKELRREERREVERKIEEAIRKEPGSGLTIDTLLRRPLARVDKAPPDDKAVQQPLAAPAPGIEPYERGRVTDRTADQIRDLDPITVTGRIFHTDRAGALRPLVNATVDVRDSDTGPDDQLTSVITGWDGRFTASVNNDDGWFQDGRDIYVRVRTTNSRFRVQDCAAWPDWTYAWVSDVRSDLSDGTVVDFGSLATNEDGEAALLFQDLNQGWSFLTSSGAQDPGFVDLCWPEGASQYSTFWEEVDIEDGDEVARDIVLHEYGHATMHNAYDGYWPSNTGGAHGFDDTLHQNMAFTEGWGTFVALAINPDGTYHSNGWSRAIEAFSHVSGHAAGDGKTNEGHVAAGLTDVLDVSADGSCTGAAACDASGASAARMSQIWRDAFWRSNAADVGEYWNRLCGELDGPQTDVALKGLAFNAIDVASCKCSASVALAGTPDAATSVKELRDLRDRGLRGTPLGRRVVDLYYRHTGEVAGRLLKDAELRRSAAGLFGDATKAYRTLKAGGEGTGVPLDAKRAALARDFARRLQKGARPELGRDLDEVLRLVDQLEGRSFEELRRKFEQPIGAK